MHTKEIFILIMKSSLIMEVIFLPIAIWLVVSELGDSETPPYFKLLLIIAVIILVVALFFLVYFIIKKSVLKAFKDFDEAELELSLEDGIYKLSDNISDQVVTFQKSYIKKTRCKK